MILAFFSHPAPRFNLSAHLGTSLSLSYRTILNSSYRLTVYSKIVSLGFGRETIFLSFFSFFFSQEKISISRCLESIAK